MRLGKIIVAIAMMLVMISSVVAAECAVPLVTGTGNQANPFVEGDKVVYEDDQSGNYDVYMYDFGDASTTQITSASSNQRWPVINGNKILYRSDESGSYLPYIYDLGPDGVYGTGDDYNALIASTAVGLPSISANRMTYQDTRTGKYEVYLSDFGADGIFGTGDDSETQITSVASDIPLAPKIDGDIVVYQYGGTIYMYDITNGVTSNIGIYPSFKYGPKVDGNIIAWGDERNGGITDDIYMYDLGPDGHFGTADDGGERRVTDEAITQSVTDIDGDKIVWHDLRYGNYDIFAYDIVLDNEARITENTASQTYPFVSGNIIVWSDQRNGNYDVYMCDAAGVSFYDCGNGALDFPEQCDDGNTAAGDGCSATCTSEEADADFSSVDIAENADGTYNYTFVGTGGVPIIEIEGNDGLMDLADLAFEYYEDADRSGLSVVNLSMSAGNTKTITIQSLPQLCVVDDETLITGTQMGNWNCWDEPGRITWAVQDGNRCDADGEIGLDADGNPTSYVCYETDIGGTLYAKLPGLSYTSVLGLVDADEDGYPAENDCNDNDASINPGASEVCDGVDNNCDGNVDEGLTQPAANQNGECSGNTEYCSAGAWLPDAGNYVPSAEVCDNLDNDCSGEIDENLVQSCYSGPAGTEGVGVCQAGTQTCSVGLWGTCTGEVLPSTEICDGLDNDCNGYTDELPECSDADGDGVADAADKCPGTIVPGSVPSEALRPDHFADLDGDFIFEVNTGSAANPVFVDSAYSLVDAYGCSCEQILYCKPGANNGEQKWGCTAGTMDTWVNQLDWSLDCQVDGIVAIEGESKDLLENTDDSDLVDLIDGDNDNDGIPDSEDSEDDSAAPEPGKQGKGTPDWWCNKHPNKC